MIKEYLPIYKPRLMDIFDSNMPKYFDPTERQPFHDFLDDSNAFYKVESHYFVYLKNKEVLGAGGYLREKEGDARIIWLLVDQSMHSKGIGSEMMNFFEQEILKKKEYHMISLKTSQLTDVFYEKLGFVTLESADNHWGPGLHLRYMEKQLNK